ncbi:RloB family protein [Pseudocolwellia agarivorans]|uniref:RloB family protein n=1 Tax=Pseudocolwellia agarivorans TaxID=1911682 RepID=UPI00098469BA|nr:RloB family protein [Pseudocolwellia agarivorans]
MPKKRKGQTRLLKSILHVYCEGEKTEPNYLNGYLDEFHSGNRTLKVIRIADTNKNTPKQLVEEAIKKKKSHDSGVNDQFWVVYDREATDKYSNELHSQSLTKARANKINVVLSNVCFEVWILLHFIPSVAPYRSCDDLLKSSKLKQKLKEKGILNYEKGDVAVYEAIAPGIAEARARAKKMNIRTLNDSIQGNDSPYLLNPYTNVHELLDAIDAFVVEQE